MRQHANRQSKSDGDNGKGDPGESRLPLTNEREFVEPIQRVRTSTGWGALYG